MSAQAIIKEIRAAKAIPVVKGDIITLFYDEPLPGDLLKRANAAKDALVEALKPRVDWDARSWWWYYCDKVCVAHAHGKPTEEAMQEAQEACIRLWLTLTPPEGVSHFLCPFCEESAKDVLPSFPHSLRIHDRCKDAWAQARELEAVLAFKAMAVDYNPDLEKENS